MDSLAIDVALGNTLPHIVVAHLTGASDDSAVSGEAATMGIRGTEGVGVTYAKCCCPLPGDLFRISWSEKGLMVHRDNCRNLVELEQPDRLISLHWDDVIEEPILLASRASREPTRGMIACSPPGSVPSV